MEESITILEAIKRDFACGEIDIRTYSPLTLAYIGDAVYDLVIRTIVVERGNTSANKLHHKTVAYVNARVQARMIEALMEELMTLEQPYHCPHGRPTMIVMSKYEIEKKFKRVV